MLHFSSTRLNNISYYILKGTTPRNLSFMPSIAYLSFRKLGTPSNYCLFATQKVQVDQPEQVKWSLTAHKTIINKRSLKKIDQLFQALTSYNKNNKEIYLKLRASSKNQLMLTCFKHHIKILQAHLLDFRKLENRYKIHKSFILALNLVLIISENYTKFLLDFDKTATIDRKYVKKELKSLNDQYHKLRTTLINRKRYKSPKEE